MTFPLAFSFVTSVLTIFAHVYCINFKIVSHATPNFLLYRDDNRIVRRKENL